MVDDPYRGTGRTTTMLTHALVHGHTLSIGSGLPVCIIFNSIMEFDRAAMILMRIAHELGYKDIKRLYRDRIFISGAEYRFYSPLSDDLFEGRDFADVYIDHHAEEEYIRKRGHRCASCT